MVRSRKYLFSLFVVGLATQIGCSEAARNKTASNDWQPNHPSTGFLNLPENADRSAVIDAIFKLNDPENSQLKDADEDEIQIRLDEIEATTSNSIEFSKEILRTFSPVDIAIISEIFRQDTTTFSSSPSNDSSGLYAKIGENLEENASSDAQGNLKSGAYTVSLEDGFINFLVENGQIINNQPPCISYNCSGPLKSVRAEKVSVETTTTPMSTTEPDDDGEDNKKIEETAVSIRSLAGSSQHQFISFWEACIEDQDVFNEQTIRCGMFHKTLVDKIKSKEAQKIEISLMQEICYTATQDSKFLKDHEYCEEADEEGLSSL